MGKATIISGGKNGLYEVDIVYNLDRIKASIAALKNQKDEIQAAIDKLELTEDHSDIPKLKLQRAAIQKSIDKLEVIPEKKRASVYCGDFTEDLTGEVGTAEVPDDPAGGVNIVPNGKTEDQAAYIPARDGMLRPIMGMGPANAWLNRAIMPAVQKYKPMYRYGKITAINGDRCDLDFLPSVDANGLSVNQAESLPSVIIQYMTCNAWRFKVGDEVLVYLDRNRTEPRVIGFKTEPKPCDGQVLLLVVNGTACVWDPFNEKFVEDIPDGSGGYLTFPCPEADLDYWKGIVPMAEKPDKHLWGDPNNGIPTPIKSEMFPRPSSGDGTVMLTRSYEGCPTMKDTSTRARTLTWTEGEYHGYPSAVTGYDMTSRWTDMRRQEFGAGMPRDALVDVCMWIMDAFDEDDIGIGDPDHPVPKYWFQEGDIDATGGYCYEAQEPGFESFSFGFATTADLDWWDEEFFLWSDYAKFTCAFDSLHRTDNASFTLKGRFNTPIDPDPVETTITGGFHSYVYYQEEGDPPYVNISKHPTFDAGSTGYPAFTKIRVAGEFVYSKKAVVQVYVSVCQACELHLQDGSDFYTEQVFSDYLRTASVAVETFETDIESEGYDPNGASQTAALSNFVQDVIATAVDTPSIKAEFRSWHTDQNKPM